MNCSVAPTESEVNVALLITTIVSSTVLLGVLCCCHVHPPTRKNRERRRLVNDAAKLRLRYVETGKLAEVAPLSEADGEEFHVFLSHVWTTGADQMRITKERLRYLVPDLKVFLDVDDLYEGRGAEYVDKSQLVCVFCSDGYFSVRATATIRAAGTF